MKPNPSHKIPDRLHPIAVGHPPRRRPDRQIKSILFHRQQLRRQQIPRRPVPLRCRLHHPPAPGCRLYAPALPRQPGAKGRPRKTGAWLANLSETLADAATVWQRVTIPGWYGEGERRVELTTGTAVWRHSGVPLVPIRWGAGARSVGPVRAASTLCTTLDYSPEQVLRWFVQRWQLEVTFEETRAHLDVETQRQWSNRAIARATPCLLGLFSLVTLLAARLRASDRRSVAASAWYRKSQPTFSDTLAIVRRHLWQEQGFLMSRPGNHVAKLQTDPAKGCCLRTLQRRLMAKVELIIRAFSDWGCCGQAVPLASSHSRRSLASFRGRRAAAA